VQKIWFLFLPIILISCEGDYSIDYHWTEMSVENYANYIDVPEPVTDTTASSEAYAIRVWLTPVETKRKGRYLDRETPPRNTNSCSDMLVTSSATYNASHLAGDTLNDFFKIYAGDYSNLLPLNRSSYMSNEDASYFFDEPYPYFVDLLMMTPPDSLGAHKFTVQMELQDGTVFIDSTTNIFLN